MKNLFFVINKEKVYAYIVSVVTIVILFFMSATINNNITTKETSTELERNVNSNIQNIENAHNMQKSDKALGEAALVSNDNILKDNNTK